MKKSVIMVGSGLVFAVFVTYALVAISLVVASKDPTMGIGAFGDAFGIFNALFAGSAFVAVVVTLNLQMQEARASRAEFAKMARIQEAVLLSEQNKASMSFAGELKPRNVIFEFEFVGLGPAAIALNLEVYIGQSYLGSFDVIQKGETYKLRTSDSYVSDIFIYYQSEVGEQRIAAFISDGESFVQPIFERPVKEHEGRNHHRFSKVLDAMDPLTSGAVND